MEPRVEDCRALGSGLLDGAVGLLPVSLSRDRINLGAKTGGQTMQFLARFILQACNFGVEIGGKPIQVFVRPAQGGAIPQDKTPTQQGRSGYVNGLGHDIAPILARARRYQPAVQYQRWTSGRCGIGAKSRAIGLRRGGRASFRLPWPQLLYRTMQPWRRGRT